MSSNNSKILFPRCQQVAHDPIVFFQFNSCFFITITPVVFFTMPSLIPVLLWISVFCHLGMVRAIDVKNKKIYITTPLSLVDLVRVNTIIRGSSNIPQQIFTEQITKVHNSVTSLNTKQITKVHNSVTSPNTKQITKVHNSVMNKQL